MTTRGAGGPPAAAEFRLRSVAVAAYGPTVLEAMGYGAAIPLVPLLARQLGAGVGLAAFIGALLGLGQLATSLPAGTVIDRVGERRAMLAAAGLGLCAALLAGVARDLPTLAAATVLTGMTWSVFLLARQGFMIDAVPAHLRARALSTLGGTHRIGMFLGPILAAPVIATYGVRSAFFFSAGMSLLAFVLVLRVPDLGTEAREAAREDPASIWQILGAHRRTLFTLGLGASAISALRGIRLSILPLWADHIGLAPAQVSVLVALGALVEIAIFYPAGWVMDRRGRVWVAVPTAVFLGAGLMAIPLTGDFAQLLAAMMVTAIGNGLGSGIVMTLGADTAPALHRPKYLGGWRLFGDIGMSGGPLAVSALAAFAGLAAASVTLGIGGVVAAGWLWHWVGALDRRRRASERMPA